MTNHPNLCDEEQCSRHEYGSFDLPAAEVIAERVYGGIRTARTLCPYCQRTHLHPWPADPTSPYAAHCGQGVYTIGTPTKESSHDRRARSRVVALQSVSFTTDTRLICSALAAFSRWFPPPR